MGCSRERDISIYICKFYTKKCIPYGVYLHIVQHNAYLYLQAKVVIRLFATEEEERFMGRVFDPPAVDDFVAEEPTPDQVLPPMEAGVQDDAHMFILRL